MRANTLSSGAREGQRGVGLVEVLIAMLVLSFGMLGLASLQMWSLRNNQSAMERGLAVVQTHSIVDAMRAERVTALSRGFDVDDVSKEVPEPQDDSFAQVSLATWGQNLRDALGSEATGSVACNGSACTITVRWNDQRGTRNDSQAEQQEDTLLEVTTEVQL
jgi:type IV pilus assembly protein PilV